jgi:hypothetical protein
MDIYSNLMEICSPYFNSFECISIDILIMMHLCLYQGKALLSAVASVLNQDLGPFAVYLGLCPRFKGRKPLIAVPTLYKAPRTSVLVLGPCRHIMIMIA